MPRAKKTAKEAASAAENAASNGSSNDRSPKGRRHIESGGLTPLGFMLDLLRDETASLEDRKWAAYHAAPYCHSRLASVDHFGDMTIRHEDALKELA